MKKLLALLILLGWTYLLWTNVFASNCLNLNFTNWNVCINIDKNNHTYTLSPDLSNTNWTVSLKCDLLISDSDGILRNVWACNWNFTYTRTDNRKIKLYVRLNNEYKTKEAYYDFDNWERWNSIWWSSSNNNYDLDNFYVTTDDSSPSTNQRVDLTVKARDSWNSTITDYDGTINYKIYYRTSSSSSWTQTTSSTYYEIDSSYDGWYTFDSSDNWIASLSNFIKFKKNNYDYKVRVYDENDSSIYKEITYYVWSSSNNNTNIDNFYVTTDDSSPSTNQRVDLTVKARDSWNSTITDYDGTINYKIYYRTSSSSSWTQTTSSTYYEIDSSYDGWYTFDSSDNWIASLSNFIKFKKNNYDYKVRVYDENDSSIYKEITYYVWSSSSSSSNGFSSSEIDKVQAVYDGWTDTISQLESNYSKLRTNNTRQNMSDDLYTEMENIVNWDNSIYDNYDDFYTAFLDRYSYTIRVR